jgi:class 3 adenylate cyclase
MEATNKTYDFNASLERIDEILNADNKQYEEKDSIPARSCLTFTNGFYVNCTALFVDICDSSKMTDEHKRPVLAKIYRSFISELVAFFNGYDICKEVNIHGDCVWAVFDTPLKKDIDTAFSAAYGANALVNILNYKLKKKDYLTYNVGIGMDYGRALMIKAGHKGSSINDVVWMGDVVNQACHYAGYVGKVGTFGYNMFLSDAIYDNLNDDNKKLCHRNGQWFCYQSSAVMSYMDHWLSEQKEKDKVNQTNNKFPEWPY